MTTPKVSKRTNAARLAAFEAQRDSDEKTAKAAVICMILDLSVMTVRCHACLRDRVILARDGRFEDLCSECREMRDQYRKWESSPENPDFDNCDIPF